MRNVKIDFFSILKVCKMDTEDYADAVFRNFTLFTIFPIIFDQYRIPPKIQESAGTFKYIKPVENDFVINRSNVDMDPLAGFYPAGKLNLNVQPVELANIQLLDPTFPKIYQRTGVFKPIRSLTGDIILPKKQVTIQHIEKAPELVQENISLTKTYTTDQIITTTPDIDWSRVSDKKGGKNFYTVADLKAFIQLYGVKPKASGKKINYIDQLKELTGHI